MKRIKSGKIVDSLQVNALEYKITRNLLMEIALSRFVWHTPSSVNRTFLEKTIQLQGKAVIFDDDVMGIIGLPCAYDSAFNIYNEPSRVRAYAVNGYQKSVTNGADAVVIFNNFRRDSIVPLLDYYASKLALVNSILNINVNAQKTPYIIKSSQEQKLTMQNILLKLEEFVPFIKVSDKWDIDSLSVLDLNAPYVADRLYDLRESLWGEALTMLGIPSLRMQKRERLLTDEINRNLGGAFARRQSYLLERKRACEKLTEIFGEKFECEFNEDIDTVVKNGEEGVFGDGGVYDGFKGGAGEANRK